MTKLISMFIILVAISLSNCDIDKDTLYSIKCYSGGKIIINEIVVDVTLDGHEHGTYYTTLNGVTNVTSLRCSYVETQKGGTDKEVIE